MRRTFIIAAVVVVLLFLTPSASSQEKPAAAPATPAAAQAPATAPAPTPDKPAAPAASDKPAAPAVAFKPGVKLFVDSMPDDFDTFIKDAIAKKKVPVTVVSKKEDADFMIRGTSETLKASTAKKVIMWNWHSDEQASIQVINLASGEVTFAYTANKQSSAHGKRSTAEACAKHLKEKLEEAK